ncbi:uncharacterized protein GVI51_I10505 [Nakaseomyces glabratus]|uniref:Peroxisomal membrane protein PEX17 n=2 Tax=Candida glabrata TaxID=5478 RepID=Q6FPY8_CANGA|nr:uncharacterized protein CAGL0I10725g [Nakaseomyces glabratus]KAH7584980.1 Family of unknown function (DUF5355) [Nakaseomyces glabratus]KAH7598116.1 Family of unknown function (DUF5355) [Nakaseomyces glabratus]KAH7599968.1 Family of unknown function (DUF5355) [Nakaseomyces glabratus]KAH7603944.1 Family of unknown function (DUF5355) [Nakaseomyces glabratus]KAH7612599.1 Family of unknown function (DUF5355) [Nakaseomyces glabratus]|eukprot:XP_447706.1 uncharacterized protein CAGL0I10725g [[Candida] glabrata]
MSKTTATSNQYICYNTGFSTPNIELNVARQDVIELITSASAPDNVLAKLFSYIQLLLRFKATKGIDHELTITTLNIAIAYEKMVLESMTVAYTAGRTDLWTTASDYLKRAIGILLFLKSTDWLHGDEELYQYLLRYTNEMGVLQQLSVVLVAITKLRSNLYKDSILDLDHSNDLTQNILSSNNITLYSRMCISALETMVAILGKHSSNTLPITIINSYNVDFIKVLIYLLVSLEQYEANNVGHAMGFLKLSRKYLTRSIMKTTDLQSSLDSIMVFDGHKKNLKAASLGKLKNVFKKEKTVDFNSTLKSLKVTFNKDNSNDPLRPLLLNVLNDLILPLFLLLSYRYEKTNQLYSFQEPIEDEDMLIRDLPKAIIMNLKSISWKISDQNELIEDTALSIGHDEYF